MKKWEELIDELKDINFSLSYPDHPQANGYDKNSNLLYIRIRITYNSKNMDNRKNIFWI